MVRRWRITQHLSEVTQVTAHTMGEPEIVTSTRGSECFVWDVETGMQKAQLKFSGTVPNAKYRYRNIRFVPPQLFLSSVLFYCSVRERVIN